MKICDLATGLGQLRQAAGRLNDHWAATKQHWNDDTSRQFEENHLQRVPGQLQLIVTALDRLVQSVASAERDCADPVDER